ncbi:MAG: NUDIX hydrolase [Propionibacteriaceae bacterium]|jgi:ADP-ribose pyrophosphatase YjhB (NUDIX family)|nr:NUDIX hydrolase [Micropruina sp.]HBX79896.1 DNA hydrolase [Propionibacteriaceae bacterium]
MSEAASRVSVDVLALRYRPARGTVEVATTVRSSEPFQGQLALPGVLLLEGERLAEAASRAVEKKLGASVAALGQLVVFDEPTRDPRGATLSAAMWAVTDGDGECEWFGLDALPELAFDHNRIVEECRPLLADKLWRDLTFTRALTGRAFPVSAAVAITTSLTDQAPDRGNLNRRLASLRGLNVSTRRVVAGRGRPGTLWEWQD